MRLSLVALLGLATIGGYAGSSPPIGAVATSEGYSTTDRHDGVGPTPACDVHSTRRQVVYYRASDLRCDIIGPSRIDASGYTHAMLAFAVFNQKTFAVDMENPDDGEVYRQFLQLPDELHKAIAIGGPTYDTWSAMSSTKTNRAAFIDSLKKFLTKWKFTGIEIHWSWLGISDRGGNVADTLNEVDLVHELREALGKDISISVVLLAQSEYLNIMHLEEMQDAVDWFTVLTYDFDHQPHANSAKVDAALNLLWSANLEPAKINMAIVNRDVSTRALELDLAKKHCLGGTSLWATGCDGKDAPLQQPESLYALGSSPVVLPRAPEGIPTDPIMVTTSARGTAIQPSIIHSNPPVVSSVAVSSHHIITSVQGSAKPSSVVWSSQPTSQVTSSHWESSVQAPAPPTSAASSHWLSSVQAPAPPSSVVWSSQPTSQAASSQWVSPVPAPALSSSTAWSSQSTSQAASSQWVSPVPAPAPSSSVVWSSQSTSQDASSQWVSPVPAPAPSSSTAWSSQSTSQAASSQWAPALSSSTAWSNQPSSQAGSSGIVPSQTVSSDPGSSAAPSFGTSAAVSSGVATSSNAWSSVSSSTASGFVPSSGLPASSVGGSSAASSSGAWGSPGSSASPSSVWSSPAGSTTAAWSLGPPASSVPIPGSSVRPSDSFSTVHSSAQGSSAAQISGSAIPSNNPTWAQGSSTPGGTIIISPGISSSSIPGVIPVFPPGILTSSTPGVTPVIPSGISGSSIPSSIKLPIPVGTLSSSTPGGVIPIPIGPPSISTPGTIWPAPIGTSTSSTPGGVIPIPIGPPSISAPGTIWPAPIVTSIGSNSGGIVPKPTGTSSNLPPSPTTMGCPKECRPFDWCNIYCEDWPFPRPIDEQPPHQCLLPENLHWCHSWWFGPVDIDGSDGDPDSHTDSDSNCKENDCVADCAAWRIATFFIFKRPICPCIPKKCDKDGDSDSPSDSDKDDPKGPKPKPTSHPKPDKPRCQLFGCGCGWMGLNFGPGCPDGKDFELDIPCGLFGCTPCSFFGSCPGADQPVNAVLGHSGYCRGAGCSPCPPEICNRPGCTIPGGCGPKPGPAPTRPSNEPDPNDCEDNQRTVITDRFVMCTENFDVSAIPSTYWNTGSTSSTMITSACVRLIDATQTICGPAQGFDTTTTRTGTNTLTSDAPACTRAPLSLDDDEGNNNPDDSLFDTSSTFASNTTMFASSTSKGTSSMTSGGSASSTSSTAPAPSHTPMDRNGHWKVEISQWMWDDYSEVAWKLYDPNGFHAGEHGTRGNGLKEMTEYIQSVNRPFGDSMPFGVNMTVSQPHDRDHSTITFTIRKKVSGCDYKQGVECRPHMTTENYIESQPFALETCSKSCAKNGKNSPLKGLADLWCDDLNTADWEGLHTGWKRKFNCGWKGFD